MNLISKLSLIILFLCTSGFVKAELSKNIQFLQDNSIIFENENLSNHTSDISTFMPSCLDYSYHNKMPYKIDILLNDQQFWKENYVGAITSKQKSINNKFKVYQKASIKVYYENKNCDYEANVRIHGDLKDHLSFNYTASLDIRLLNGNILGNTSFKLFIPETRNGNNEIFMNGLLKYLNLAITSHTFFIDTNFNGIEKKLLFQSKINKNLIENNNFREGLIIEADERFMFGGDRQNLARSDSLSFFRLINQNWLYKSNKNLYMSLQLLKRMNSFIIRYHTQDNFNDYLLFDNSAFAKEKELLNKYAKFELLQWITGSSHGLRPTNRKFYYDSIKKELIPILYDSNARILNSDQSYFERDINASLISHSYQNKTDSLLEDISKINLNKFQIFLKNNYNFEISDETLIQSFSLMKKRINKLNSLTTNIENHAKVPYRPIEDAFSSKKSNIKFVFDEYNCKYDEIECLLPKFEACNINLENCSQLILDNSDLKDLISQRLKIKDTYFIYFGLKKIFRNKEIMKFDYNNYKFKKLFIQNNVYLKYNYEHVYVELNYKDKIINLNFNSPYGKVILENGYLENFTINIINNYQYRKNIDKLDSNLLTGCVTFYDIELNDVSINSDSSECEDAINFIRSSGHVSSINVVNNKFDAIDFDFSNITIDEVTVNKSGNDCIDFSDGIYVLNSANLLQCGDKGISVGENSNVNLNNINIGKSLNGIVSKDSSRVYVRNSIINSSDKGFCLSAYRKKQEFDGAFLNFSNVDCSNNSYYMQKGSKIEFYD